MTEENTIKKIRFGVELGWWALLIYMAVVFFLIYQDSRTNTEYYALIESRPPYDPSTLIKQGDNYITPNGQVIPSWHFEANTINECKPMKRLSDLWSSHGNNILFGTLLLSVITFILNNWNRISRLMKKAEEMEKE